MEKKNLRTKKMIILSLCVVTLVFACILGTYAYFMANISNNERQEVQLDTGTMRLRFADNDNGIYKTIALGETVTKKFTLENTGTLETSLSLDWDNLVNTYTNGSLTYRLTYCKENCDNESAVYEELMPESNVPVSKVSIYTPLASELSVPTDTTYYYNLEITLNDLEEIDQTSDTNAIFSTKFNIGNPTKYRYYKLSVNPNGGTWNEFTSIQEYQLLNDDIKEIPNPERVGYIFDGWEIDGVSSVLEGTTLNMGISDTYLKAKWITKKFDLTIIKNGVEDVKEVNYGDEIDLGIPEEKVGYTFAGWEATGGRIEGNTLFITEDKDINVTGKYIANKYKYIVYHNKMNIDGVGYTLIEADTDEGEAEYNTTISPSVKTYTGFTKPATKSLTIQIEEEYPPVKNKVEYNYERNKYTLTVNPNGGVYSGSTEEKLYYEQTKTLVPPEKIGYNFTNWTGTGITIESNTITMGTNDATVTANYTPKTFSITYNANGGTPTTQSKIVTYNNKYILPTEPTYEGYEFLGWYTEKTGGEKITEDTDVKVTDNQTLYAHWKEKEFNAIEAVTAISKNQIPKGVKTGPQNFSIINNGVYSMEDDYGTSYYYRGTVENNYLLFGNYYWRIIRVNGDGSVKIIYDGTIAHKNNENSANRFTHTNVNFNTNGDDAKYLGWMYSPEGTTASTSKAQAQTNTADSDIKKIVDAWYKTNIVDKNLNQYVKDEIFCNDRSTPGKDATGDSDDTGLGYGTNYTLYGAFKRFRYLVTTSSGTNTIMHKNNGQPTFKCLQENDAFTVSSYPKGNGKLTYPVGLISADEAYAAGNTSSYLYNAYSDAWTMTPIRYHYFAQMVSINNDNEYNNKTKAISPVINLKPEYVKTMIGDGTVGNPFRADGIEP